MSGAFFIHSAVLFVSGSQEPRTRCPCIYIPGGSLTGTLGMDVCQAYIADGGTTGRDCR